MEIEESRTILGSLQTLFTVGTASALSDGRLIEMFVGRSDDAAEVAFAALVKRHGPMVFRVCLGVLHDEHAAEDAFQATFLILARKADAVRNHESVASWLFGVARHAAMRTKAQRMKRIACERRFTAMAKNHTPNMDSPVLMPEIQEEIDRLPEKYRAPIVLCYLEGLTHEEVASWLHVPIGTVKTRLMRANERLRSRLVRRGLAPALVAATVSRRASAIAIPVVNETIKAAVQIAAGRAAGVSAPVAALLEGVLNAMHLTQLKTTASLVAAGMTLFLATTFAISAIPGSAKSDQPRLEPTLKGGSRKLVVESLKKSQFGRTTTQIGTVQASESIDLTPKFAGYLKSLKVDIGDVVTRGQIVAEMDPAELAPDLEKCQAMVEQARARVMGTRAAVRVAAATLEAGKANLDVDDKVRERYEATLRYHEKKYRRYKDLFEQKSIPSEIASEEEEQFKTAKSALAEVKAKAATAKAGIDESIAKLEKAKTDVEAALADLHVAEVGVRKAKMLLDSTTIISPLDGIVTRRSYHAGAFVHPAEGGSASLLTIIGTGKMRVVVEVPDRDAPLLDKGDQATMRIDAIHDRVFQGTIARTSYAENPQTRTVRAEIDLDNTEGRLRPGQFGLATIVLENFGNRLTVPMSAIAIDPADAENRVCYRVKNGQAVLTCIKLGQNNGDRVEVTDGLSEGDQVIIQPDSGITDGQMIDADSLEISKKR